MNTIRFYDTERDELMTKVERGIRSFCIARRLFAWEDFIEDTLSMVATEMCRRDFKGTVAFYVSIGKQLAITGARERSVQKRRCNFDTTVKVNLEDAFNIGEEDRMPFMSNQMREDQIIAAIKEKFGDKVALYVEGIFKGTELTTSKGKELSEAQLANKIRREFKDKDITELKELILAINENEF